MLEFIAANLPIIICFVVGIGLLILEAFMPGFGAPGITGVILEVITLVMTWFEHGPVATLARLLIVLLVLSLIPAIVFAAGEQTILLSNTAGWSTPYIYYWSDNLGYFSKFVVHIHEIIRFL